MKTGNSFISNSKLSNTFIIAEIAQAHEGSLGIAHSYIDALAKTGVDAVKFQVHIAEAESSAFEPFRVKFSYEDDTRFDYWKRMEFSLEQWKGLKAHCDEVGVEFMASPFSQAAVELLEEVGVKRYKIGSGEVSNYLMLEKICRTGKPVILSSGMSSFAELDEAVAFIASFGNDLTVLQCTTAYPTPPEKLGLNVLEALRNRYPSAKVGLSEHTSKIYAGLAAVALGATMLEFHAVFSRQMFGPDAGSSLEMSEIKQLVEGVRHLEVALSNPVDKTDNSGFTPLKKMFEKTLAVNRSLPKGHILRFEDLEAKKPAGHGIPAARFREVVGKELSTNVSAWQFLEGNHLLT